jgi:hypothetical protein
MSASVSSDRTVGLILAGLNWNSTIRKFVICALLMPIPRLLFGVDSDAAMIHVNGAAAVNSARIPRDVSAILPGDVLQTGRNSAAQISKPGSSIAVQANSLVEYQGAAVDVQYGGITVSTSKGMTATAGDVRVSPVSNAWAEFDVVDTNGVVKIAARKGNLSIDDGNTVVTLLQGQETTRDENDPTAKKGSKRMKKRRQGASPAATGGTLNSRPAVALGIGVDLSITTWVLRKHDEPASPSKP